MKCKKCAWNYTKEEYEFCQNMKDPDTCPRFFAYDRLGYPIHTQDVTNEECPVCKRDKDPGQKCWWCGN